MTQELRPESPTTSVPPAWRAADDATAAVSPGARYAPPRPPGPPAGWGPGAPGPYGPGPYGPGPYGSPAPASRTEGTAVGALVCGFLAAPVGVVLGVVALRRIRTRGTTGKGLAVAGIVLGTLLTLATIALIVGFVALVSSGVGGSSTTACTDGICETTVRGTPIAVDDVGDDDFGKRFVVVSVADGSAQVQGDTDPAPTAIPAGESFTVDGVPVELVSASGGTAVFRYRR